MVLKIQRDQNNIARELAKIARIRNSSAAWLAGVRSGAIGYCRNEAPSTM
jgi:hypothetical protein